MEKRLEKTAKDIALIAKEVVNLLADKKCTIDEADNVLRITKISIDSTAMVRKLEYQILFTSFSSLAKNSESGLFAESLIVAANEH